MANRNTATLVDLIERGRMSLNELTRKERKAVQRSMSVSKEVREYQSQTQVSKNQYDYTP